MADFTDQDQEILDKLRKVFERTGKTTSTRDPWQERMVRDASAPSRSILASKIIEGFAGSWAAQYKYGLGSTIAPTVAGLPEEPTAPPDPDGPPIPIRAKTSKIGQRGVPEINFTPFNWYTNTFGTKGPSLTGHPISYEVIGPTLKSPFCDWAWDVLEGAGPSGGDLLRMTTRPDGSPPVSTTIADGYNIPIIALGTPTEPNGGLYVIISDDGVNPGSIPAGRLPMGALPEFLDTAKYEIFRIILTRANEIELHPDKPLSRFFDLPVTSVDRSIRSITVIAPFVTRLQAFPDSGAGAERQQTFAILTPERAAASDLYPPFDGATGSWTQGGFTLLTAPDDPGAVGSIVSGLYGGKMRLPIPQPIREGVALLRKSVPLLPPDDIGLWSIETASVGYTTDQVLRISSTSRDDDLLSMTFGNTEACMGWFPIEGIRGPGPNEGLILSRNAEVNPQTGLVFWGPGPYISSASLTENFQVGFTVHEPVSSLWGSLASPIPFNIDQVEAATLKNIIDPNWVGRFEKMISDPVGGGLSSPAGSGAGRPDRAIFNTAINSGSPGPVDQVEDPGSLMDLGFRVVLYPAKEDPNNNTLAIPDFDRPLYSRETIIDGSINEKQWIDIDYSAGLVRLSHPPPTQRNGIPDEPSDIIPNGIQGTTGNNQRAEVMLFAACVPYSMEDSQIGTGNRLTADNQTITQTDVYSTEVSAQILDAAQTAGGFGTTFVGVAPFIGISDFPAPTGVVEIILTDLWDGPPTGVISISSGSDVSPAFGRWGYTEIGERVLPSGKTVTTLGGITSHPGVGDPTPIVGQHRLCVLRREVFFGPESFSLPSITDFYPEDTYYGNAQRAETVRFQNATLEPQLDGSVIHNPRPDLSLFDKPWGSAMPSKLSWPIANPDSFGTALVRNNYLAEDGFLKGLNYEIGPLDPFFPSFKGPVWDTSFTGLPGMYFYAPSGAADNWHGVITDGGDISTPGVSRGILHTTDNFRMTSKFTYLRRNVDTLGTAFIGFVQDDGIGAFLDPLVADYTLGTGMVPRFSAVGLLLDQSSPSGDQWMFWTRGSAGDFLFPTGIFSTGVGTVGPLYFVMEYKRVPPIRVGSGSLDFVGTTECRMAVYDQNLRCVASTVVTQSDRQPAPGLGSRGLFWCFGMRTFPPVASTPFLYTHGTTIVADVSLPRIGPVPPFPTS